MFAIVLLILISIYNLVVGNKNYNKAVWENYVLMLAVPLSSYSYLDTVSILKIGSFSVLELSILELFIIGFIKQKIIKIRKNWVTMSVIILLAFYFINILMNLEKARCISDAKDYIIPIILFICIYSVIDKTCYIEVIKYSLKGIYINAIISLLIYLLFWTRLGEVSRYGFSYESLFVFSIPVQFIWLIQKNYTSQKEKHNYILGILIEIYLMLISQTRTVIFCVVLVMAIYVIVSLLLKSSPKNKVRNFIIFIFTGLGMLALYYYLFTHQTSNIGWIHRISEVFTSGLNTQSNQVRWINIEYYKDLIGKKIYGYGFGTLMPIYAVSSNEGITVISSDTMGMDNLLITYAYKCGLICLVVYLYIHIKSLLKALKLIRSNRDTLIVFISLCVLIIPTVIMSVQALKNITVACFWWTFVASISFEVLIKDRNCSENNIQKIHRKGGG